MCSGHGVFACVVRAVQLSGSMLLRWCVMAANVQCSSAFANQMTGCSGQKGGKRAATLLASGLRAVRALPSCFVS